MIWREKRILLIILGVLLAGNVVFFLTYRVQYQSRLDEMDERLAAAEGQLQQSRQVRADAEAKLAAYKKVENDVASILDEHWSTQPRRLTKMIGEVKRLADASNAVPRSYTFAKAPAEAVLQPGQRARKVSIGAEEVVVSFSVDASYDQIRRLINLIELSQQFMIIDGIALSSGSGENALSLTLKLKTLFREEGAPGEAKQL